MLRIHTHTAAAAALLLSRGGLILGPIFVPSFFLPFFGHSWATRWSCARVLYRRGVCPRCLEPMPARDHHRGRGIYKRGLVTRKQWRGELWLLCVQLRKRALCWRAAEIYNTMRRTLFFSSSENPKIYVAVYTEVNGCLNSCSVPISATIARCSSTDLYKPYLYFLAPAREGPI